MLENYLYPTIMLIDDNRIDSIMNKKVLEKEKIAKQILIFNNANIALDHLRKLDKLNNIDTNEVPSLILLDMYMPEMDGFMFVDEYDKLSDTIKDNSKIVFVTSSLLTKDQQATLMKKNVVKFVGKPLAKSRLDEILEAMKMK
jgi:CheY-like chemotaxis protein